MPPPFFPVLALSSCSFCSLTYVLSLYSLVPFSIRQLDRNDPRQIQARILSALASSAVALCVTGSTIYYQRGSVSALPDLLGLRSANLFPAMTLPVGSFVLLFAGPLTQIYVLNQECYNWFPDEPWINVRNLVVAPFTEEFVFRSCIGSLMIALGGFPYPSVVFGAPLFFGLAHVHHGISSVAKGEPPVEAMTRAAFQTLYTTLFGALQMLVFLKTGHLVSAVMVHAWCNFMGLPRIDLLIDESRVAVTRGQANKSRWRLGLTLSAYALGIGAFCQGAFSQATDPLFFRGAYQGLVL